MHVLLAEAELEPIPKEIRDRAAVRNHAERVDRPTGSLLLDQNVHRPAMKGMDDEERRGRPDITHYCLLHLLEHPVSTKGGMQVAVHTRHGDLIRFNHETRLPRGEVRFQGVMAKVLRDRPDQDASGLVWHEGICNPHQALERFARGPVVRLDEAGTALTPLQVVDQANKEGDLTVVLGAFPRGDWSSAWQKAAPETVSIWPEALNAWVVAAEVAAAWRTRHGPH